VAVIKRLASAYSARARARRARLFNELLKPKSTDRILDLGSEDGAHFASVISLRENVTIADIDAEALERGRQTYGFRTALLGEDARLPFEDDEFDIVFCSSVIEHVTVDKDKLWDFDSNETFQREALVRQKQMADEIARIGKRYFVQTPNRYFWVESHTWLPGIVVLLPRKLLYRLIRSLGTWWPKGTQPDWNLLTSSEMQLLFPEATIQPERSLGLIKSLIAVRF